MKFLVFIALVVLGWYGMKWLQQAGTALRQNGRQNGQQQNAKAMRAMDTTVCQRCGTYVPAEFPTACDRRDCPFPGVG
jgi:Carlavirus putative nucleic acid binding protein